MNIRTVAPRPSALTLDLGRIDTPGQLRRELQALRAWLEPLAQDAREQGRDPLSFCAVADRVERSLTLIDEVVMFSQPVSGRPRLED